MNFEDVLKQINPQDLSHTLTIPTSWAQGRTVFGGLSAALLYRAMRCKIEPSRVLRSMNTSFVAPLAVEKPISIEVELLREGRSVSQVIARAIQDQQTCVLTQASFGKHRESRILVESESKHSLVSPEKCLSMVAREGITPSFLSHFDLSVCVGAVPFSNSTSHDLGGWMRFSNSKKAPMDEHLIALIDVWPSPILQMLDSFAPASSLSWNLEFIHPHSALKADCWFAYEAITRQAAAGYSHSESNIWNEAGELIAISRQAVVAYQ